MLTPRMISRPTKRTMITFFSVQTKTQSHSVYQAHAAVLLSAAFNAHALERIMDSDWLSMFLLFFTWKKSVWFIVVVGVNGLYTMIQLFRIAFWEIFYDYLESSLMKWPSYSNLEDKHMIFLRDLKIDFIWNIVKKQQLYFNRITPYIYDKEHIKLATKGSIMTCSERN